MGFVWWLSCLCCLFSSGFGFDFSVWAPHASTVSAFSPNKWTVNLTKNVSTGVFSGSSSLPQVSDPYQLLIDASFVRLDPVCQERDGDFCIITNTSFPWQSASNFTIPDPIIIYELHVPSFAGDLDGATKKLPYLKALGVSVVELMPVADFLGDPKGWGLRDKKD